MSEQSKFERMKARLEDDKRNESSDFNQRQEAVLEEIQKAMETQHANSSVVMTKIASGFTRKMVGAIPSVGDILGDIVDSNPALSTINGMYKMFSGHQKDADKERQQMLQDLHDQITQMNQKQEESPQSKPEPVVAVSPTEADLERIHKVNDRQLEVMMDLYEVWTGATHILQSQLFAEEAMQRLAEEQERDRERDRLRQEEENRDNKKLPTPADHNTKLDKKKFEFTDMLDDIIGGLVGGGAVGLAALATKIKKFTKGAVKLLGRVAIVATTLYDFYQGFTDPSNVLGRAANGIGDQIQAGVVNVFSQIGALIDWVAEFAGFDLNLEDLTKEYSIMFIDKIRNLVSNVPNIVASIFDAVSDAYNKIKDEAFAKAMRAMNAYDDLKSYLTVLFDTIMTGVVGWLSDMVAGLTELPYVGKHIKKAIDAIKDMAPDVSVENMKESAIRAKDVIVAEQTKERDKEKETKALRQMNGGGTEPVPQTNVQTNVSKSTNVTNYNSTEINPHNDEPSRRQATALQAMY